MALAMAGRVPGNGGAVEAEQSGDSHQGSGGWGQVASRPGLGAARKPRTSGHCWSLSSVLEVAAGAEGRPFTPQPLSWPWP